MISRFDGGSESTRSDPSDQTNPLQRRFDTGNALLLCRADLIQIALRIRGRLLGRRTNKQQRRQRRVIAPGKCSLGVITTKQWEEGLWCCHPLGRRGATECGKIVDHSRTQYQVLSS